MLTPKPKLLKKVKEKLVPWIEICKHYYQNKSHQGESWTENHWHSRRNCYATTIWWCCL